MTVEETTLPAGVEIVTFARHADPRGSVVVGELERLVPFTCRRFFFVHDVPPGGERGGHAHRNCHQLLVGVKGRVRAHVDDGTVQADIVLDRPDLGLYMPPLVWGTQHYQSESCSLLVFASHPYDPEEYIHDYGDFLALKGLPR